MSGAISIYYCYPFPILLAYPNAKIYQFSDTGIREISYEETEHFRVTKDFLNNYQKEFSNC
jgi:predicted ATPase